MRFVVAIILLISACGNNTKQLYLLSINENTPISEKTTDKTQKYIQKLKEQSSTFSITQETVELTINQESPSSLAFDTELRKETLNGENGYFIDFKVLNKSKPKVPYSPLEMSNDFFMQKLFLELPQQRLLVPDSFKIENESDNNTKNNSLYLAPDHMWVQQMLQRNGNDFETGLIKGFLSYLVWKNYFTESDIANFVKANNHDLPLGWKLKLKSKNEYFMLFEVLEFPVNVDSKKDHKVILILSND